MRCEPSVLELRVVWCSTLVHAGERRSASACLFAPWKEGPRKLMHDAGNVRTG